MAQTLVFPRGTLVQFTSGKYSDFGTCGLVVTLMTADLPKLAKQYRAEYKAKDDWDQADLDDFASWLVSKQVCAPVQVSEVHLGSYCGWAEELSE